MSFILPKPTKLNRGFWLQLVPMLIAIVAISVGRPVVANAEDEAARPAIELLRPQIGMTYTEDGDEVRWFAVRARVVNQSTKEVDVPLNAWRLKVGAASLQPHRNPDDELAGAINQFDLYSWELESEAPEAAIDLKLAPGKEGKTLLAFSGLPIGGRLPSVKLVLDPPGAELQTIDIDAEFNRRLTIKRETLGPRSAIAVVRLEGDLNPVNLQLLADSLNDSVEAGQSRLIVCLAGLKQAPDSSVIGWLRQMTSEAGFGEDFVSDLGLASVPGGVADFHVAVSESPRKAAGDSAVSPGNTPSTTRQQPDSNRVGNPDRNPDKNPARSESVAETFTPQEFFRQIEMLGERNAHATLGEAIDAAVRPLCDTLPRATLLSEIRNGHAATQAAVLKHSAERLLVDDLPLVIALSLNADRSHSDALQLAAVHVLRDFGEPTAINALETLVRSSSARSATTRGVAENVTRDATNDVATTAAASLATSRFSAAQQRLIALSQDEDPVIRSLVLRTMARHPRTIWAEQLRTLALAADVPSLRTAALTGLVAIGHPQLIDILSRCLEDDDVDVSAETLQLISQQAQPEAERLALNWILKRLAEAPPTPAMLDFLLRTRSQECIPLLRRYLDADSPVRSRVVAVLVTVGEAELIAELAQRIDQWDWSDRERILRALYVSRNPLFWKIARSTLEDSTSPLISTVISLLTESGTPKSVELLAATIERDGLEGHATTICYSLAQIATQDARRRLQTVWRTSKHPEWKSAARGALEIVYQKSPAIMIVQQGLSQFLPSKNLALENFELAVEVDPDLPIARGQRANAILKLDEASDEQLKKAEADCRFMIEWEPDDSQHPTGLALALIRRGQLEDGLQAAESIREQYAENPLYLYNSACVAGRAIEQLQQTAPDNEPLDAAAAREERIRKYRAQALTDLRGSIKFGLDDFNIEWMKRDPDLKSIRESPEFAKLLEQE